MPQENVPLSSAEAIIKRDVNSALAEHKSELALNMWQAAYDDFARTHSKDESQKFLADTTKAFKDQDVLQNMEAVFGEHLKPNPNLDPTVRISNAELKKIENSGDAFSANMAFALETDIPNFLSENDKDLKTGGVPFVHWFGKPVDGVGLDDLDHHLDQFEHRRRAIELQRDLLLGNSDSIFNEVAKHAGKQPATAELTKDNFIQFYFDEQAAIAKEKNPANQHYRQDRLDVVKRTIQAWDQLSGNLLTDRGLLSKSEMGVALNVKEMDGKRVNGLVYRAAEVLKDDQLFNKIGQGNEFITAHDIRSYLKDHGKDLSEFQHDVLKEISDRLLYRPQDHTLGLIADETTDASGRTYLIFSKTSIVNGEERYLSK